MRNFLMASDAVTAGHPDKLCDQISDAVVDAWLAGGGRAGIAAECALASGVLFLAVRAGRKAAVDPAEVARRVIGDCGYPTEALTVVLDLTDDAELSETALSEHPPPRMTTAFGYACDHTANAMPAPIAAARRIAALMDAGRTAGSFDWLSPDASAQVAVRFEDRRPVSVSAVALTVGTVDPMTPQTVEEALRAEVVAPALEEIGLALEPGAPVGILARPGGAGPASHSGLTGRKTAEDSYGAFVRHSGSALSGKDPSRIDRVANYAARHVARAVLAAGLARECEVQLTYLAGHGRPFDLEVDTYGTGRVADRAISDRLRQALSFDPEAIAERLGLWELPAKHGGAFYRHLAAHGHMGRTDLDAPWEEVGDAGWLAG